MSDATTIVETLAAALPPGRVVTDAADLRAHAHDYWALEAIRDRGPSGRFGRIGLPFLAAFGVVFPLLAPIVDVMTIYGLAVSGDLTAGVAWLAMLGLQLFTAVIAFRLDRESLRPLWSLPLQQFVYRQLLYIVLVRSVAAALAGVALRWHKLQRTGAAAAHASGSVPRPVRTAPGQRARPSPTTGRAGEGSGHRRETAPGAVR